MRPFYIILFFVGLLFLAVPQGSAGAKSFYAYKDLTPQYETIAAPEGDRMQNRRERMNKRLEQLPPEKREEHMKRFQERREQIRKELEGLPEDERNARMEELREEFKEKQKQRHEEARAKLEEKWENASPEERAVFCDRLNEKCMSLTVVHEKNRICAMAAEKCAKD